MTNQSIKDAFRRFWDYVVARVDTHNESTSSHADIRNAIPTKVSELTNDSNYLTSYTETDPTVPDWAKEKNKPTYTANEVGADPVNTASTLLETHNSISDAHSTLFAEKQDKITGTQGQVVVFDKDGKPVAQNLDIPTKVSDLINDSNFVDGNYVQSEIAALVNSAPDKLNTLDELAAALNDDENFATTINNKISEKQDKITGTQGQVVGFNSEGKPVAQNLDIPDVSDQINKHDTDPDSHSDIRELINGIKQEIPSSKLATVEVVEDSTT